MTRRKRSPEENERRAKIRELLLSSNTECQKSGGAGGTASCRGYRGGAPNPCAAALSPQTSVALFAGDNGQLCFFRQAENTESVFSKRRADQTYFCRPLFREKRMIHGKRKRKFGNVGLSNILDRERGKSLKRRTP